MPLPYSVKPSGSSVASQPVTIADLLDDYDRRTKNVGTTHGQNLSRLGSWTLTGAKFGGIGAGVGAAAAGIAALLGKRAKTARTDFAVGDARDAVGRAYQQFLGRQAAPEEIATHLQHQGYQGQGSRWVGEGGLNAVLQAIQGSDEAKQFAARAVPGMGTGVPGSGMTSVQARARQYAPQNINQQALLDLLKG